MPSQRQVPILTARSDRALAFVGGGIVASTFWVWLLSPAPASAPTSPQAPAVAPVVPMSLSDLSARPLAANGVIQRQLAPIPGQYTRSRTEAPDTISTAAQPGASAPVATPAPAVPLLPVDPGQAPPVRFTGPAPLPIPTDMPPPMPRAAIQTKQRE
jgi:hypothetical protein